MSTEPRPHIHVERNRARALRRNCTTAEQFLWQQLRNRHLWDVKFRRQVPIGSFIADFVCFESRLVIELDGEHHEEPDQAAYDERRTTWLNGEGFRVIRFRNEELDNDWNEVRRRIVEALGFTPRRVKRGQTDGE